MRRLHLRCLPDELMRTREGMSHRMCRGVSIIWTVPAPGRYNAHAMTTSNPSSTSNTPEQGAGSAKRTSRRSREGAAPASSQPPASLWDEAPEREPALPDAAPRSAIRDSLYDLIPLGALELDVLDTPEFVRLQGVKQLGFCYRVWPGATHTRFEHSLGVYYLMLRALRMLRTRAVNTPNAISADATDLRTLLAAALLHDVGHYPFSHAIEELGYPIVPHERVGRRIIEGTNIAGVLERHGLRPERVADLVDPPRDHSLPPSDALLIRLLSGPLDVDKLDYLPRDARACNVPYGGVDMPRLQGSLRVHPSVNGQPRVVVTHKGISPLHSLLHARQEMFDNIYWHHTSRAFQVMLVRAVYDALSAGALRVNQLMGLSDASLLALLTQPQMPASSQMLGGDIELRRPYKGVLEVSRLAGRLFNRLDALFWDGERRHRIEQQLATELATALETEIADYEVLFDIPRPEK